MTSVVCGPSPARCGALVALLALLWTAACTTPVDPNYLKLLERPGDAGLDEVAPSANTLGASDKLAIRVYEEELGGEFVISPDGTINFPLVGKLTVNGLTCSEVEDTLTTRLREGYLRDPSVSCSVIEFNSKKVSVFGEVKRPGNFRYEDRMSVVEAVTSAGGFTERASPNQTTLVRVVQGEKVRVRVPMGAIVEGQVENLLLQPGDIIFVPERFY